MANKHNDGIIRVFSILGHGKGEVDHVSGLAKVAIRRHVNARGVVLDANDCAVFLQEKFGQADTPAYVIQEISVELLTEMRREARLKSYPIMIKGSSRFQVMVFKPNANHFRAANFLCICAQCRIEYGTCSNFLSYELHTGVL